MRPFIANGTNSDCAGRGAGWGAGGSKAQPLSSAVRRITTRKRTKMHSLSPAPLDKTTSHSTRLQKTAAKSLVIPRAVEGGEQINMREPQGMKRFITA
jgi:hypothetical protein